MDLRLARETVLNLGSGDALDRAILRTLATEGASTLATVNGLHNEDLRQHPTDTRHWISQEDVVNPYMAERLRQSLVGLGKEPRAVVIHLDSIERTHRRGWTSSGWGRESAHFRRSVTETALAAVGGLPRALVVLVDRLPERENARSAARRLRRSMAAVARRAREFAGGYTLTVNSVLIGRAADLRDAAQLIALLCSPLVTPVSGALLPVGDDERGFEFDEDET